MKRNIILAILLLTSFLAQLPILLAGLAWGLFVFLAGMALRNQDVRYHGLQVMIAYDQAANTATGGDVDETISSRTGKYMHSRPWAKSLAKFLNLFERDHATKSIEADEGSDRLVE